MNDLSGDYPYSHSPLQAYADKSQAQESALEARAPGRSNVHIDLSSGKVVAKAHATMPTVHVNLLDTTVGCRTEKLDPSLSGPFFTVTKTSVSCPLTRTLIWAAAANPPKPELTIIGWHCVGTGLSTGEPATYGRLTCSKGGEVVEAQSVSPRLAAT